MTTTTTRTFNSLDNQDRVKLLKDPKKPGWELPSHNERGRRAETRYRMFGNKIREAFRIIREGA